MKRCLAPPITQYKQLAQRRATYDELVATGGIGLIRNRMLRETALRVYTMGTFENLTREALESGHCRRRYVGERADRRVGEAGGVHALWKSEDAVRRLETG
jgi:hypothetical protein